MCLLRDQRTKQQTDVMDNFSENYQLLEKRFPSLAERLRCIDPDLVQLARTSDGGYAYLQKKPDGGEQDFVPLSDPHQPIRKAQEALQPYLRQLAETMQPAVVVGLYPGFILDMVYNCFLDLEKATRVFRRIYVIVDRLPNLVGWLKVQSRARYLEHPAIEFYWHEDIEQIVAKIREDEQRSHEIIPVSALPEVVLNRVIEPFARLYLERQEESQTLYHELCEYYAGLDDATLARLMRGEGSRPPRLLFVTHRASTVVQYTARALCEEMLPELGWQARIYSSERSCSAWHIRKVISEFRPDVVVMANHLRTEHGQSFPPDLCFVTWIQDTCPYINNREAARNWLEAVEERKRDFLIGYVDQLIPYGYPPDRLFYMPMLTAVKPFGEGTSRSQTEVDVVFASRCGSPTRERVLELLAEFRDVHPLPFDAAELQLIHDELWRFYRSGSTITGEDALLEFLNGIAPLRDKLASLSHEDRSYFLQRVFWRLNDIIYRQVVVEWLCEYAENHPGFRLELYGEGWERQPRFAKYACGELSFPDGVV
ncbi:MAG: hypothetical protein D6820_13775, partial [Lentisphaerae bacterium]